MKKRNMKVSRACLSLLTIVMLMAVLCPAALADTDGTEPQITQQPDQLVLQLGTRWAGVEFELRTDAGVFPAPIVVDSNGVLTMDLGGSTTYTLSCINSTVPIPDPLVEQNPAAQDPSAQEPTQTPAANDPQQDSGLPTTSLVLFLMGLACAVGGLAALYLSKRRRQPAYDDWEDEDDEEY